jgi:N utilization substance protein A
MDHLIATALGLDTDPSAPPRPVRLVSATVVAANPDAALLTFHQDGQQVTGVMPVTEFPAGRTWAVGQTVTALVSDDNGGRPLLSLTHPDLVPALLESISPEVRSGAVRVMGVARRPGQRTKIAVAATEPGVDPIAACVGRGHNRVDYVKAALLGEQVDIIAWHPDRATYLRNCLQPASVNDVVINEEERTAVATAPGHQMSAAVGGGGLNSALSGQLVGLMVRIIPAA